MSDHRQLVMDALVTALRGINTQGDYMTDAGARVFEFRDPVNEPLDAKECPCITIRETNAQGQSLTHTVHRYTMAFEVSGHAVDQDNTPARLRELRADILLALGADTTLGGLVQYIEIGTEEMNVERRGKKVGSIRMQFETRYDTLAFDPYTQHEQPT